MVHGYKVFWHTRFILSRSQSVLACTPNNPLEWSICLGQNVELISGLHAPVIHRHYQCHNIYSLTFQIPSSNLWNGGAKEIKDRDLLFCVSLTFTFFINDIDRYWHPYFHSTPVSFPVLFYQTVFLSGRRDYFEQHLPVAFFEGQRKIIFVAEERFSGGAILFITTRWGGPFLWKEEIV